MASNAGYKSRVKFKTGATVFTDEATTNPAGNRYIIADLTKSIFDPDTTVVVKDGGTPIAASGFSVNHLSGEVVLGSAPAGAVTISGAYLTTADAIKAYGFSFNASNAMLDDTEFGDEAQARCPGLSDATGTISRIADGLQDFDTGQNVWGVMSGKTLTVIECTPNRDNPNHVFRAFAYIETDEVSSAADDRVTAALTWQSTLIEGKVTSSFYMGTLGT